MEYYNLRFYNTRSGQVKLLVFLIFFRLFVFINDFSSASAYICKSLLKFTDDAEDNKWFSVQKAGAVSEFLL